MNIKPVMIYHHRTRSEDAQGIHIQEMCTTFANMGWEVKLIALVKKDSRQKTSGKKSKEAYAFLWHVPAFVFEIMALLYNFLACWKIYWAVKKNKAKFIYERYSLYTMAGVWASFLTKVPLILEINSPLATEVKEHGKLAFPRLAQKIETWLIEHSFKTVAVSHELKKILVRHGACADKIMVVPNGIHWEDYAAEIPRLGSKDHCVIGFVGWFRAWHKLAECIESFAQNKVFEKGAKVLLVGDGFSRPQIEEVIQKYSLRDRVTITGGVSLQEVHEHLRTMDIVLQPAVTSYASPMKMIEYMAAGKAIVSTDLDNIKEILTDGKNGLLFPDGDWNAMSERVLRLLEDPGLRLSLGQAARERILERPYTWEQNAKEVLQVLGF